MRLDGSLLSSSLSWSLCYRLPLLRLIAWDASAEELHEAEKGEGGKGYLERVIRFLAMTNGEPRLLYQIDPLFITRHARPRDEQLPCSVTRHRT
ncbi:hypothetical protein PENSPDRAFT_657395, partial [Peniophora sp. CONT]